MSILSNIKSLFTKSFANPVIFGFFQGQNKPMMGEKEQLKAFKGWVFTCVNAIAERVADTELFLEKRNKDGSYTRIEDHPILDVLHHVNDFMTLNQLMFHYSAMQELNGNTFWNIVRNGSGKICEIWPLDPTRVEINKSKDDFIESYTYTNEEGQKAKFQLNEMVHFKRFNPTNEFRGMGTVEAAGVAIDTDTFAGQWQRNFFGNSAIPAALLTSTKKLNQDQYDRIKANWDAKYKGTENANKLAILEGDIDYKVVTNTPQEMQFSESRKDLRDEILAIFRVPKVILGITEDVNFASAQATEYIFSKYIISPKRRQFVTTLNEQYLPLFNLDPYEYRLNYAEKVPENMDQKLAELKAAVNVWRTVNEIRADEGRDKIEGGDDLYITTLQTPIQSPDPEGKNQDNPPAGKTITLKEARKLLKEKRKRIAKLNKQARKIKINIKAVSAKRNALVRQETTAQFAVYKKLNDQLKQMLFDNLKNKGVRPAIRKANIYKSTQKKEAAANDLVKILFQNYTDWVGLVFNATKDGMKKVMAESGKTALAEVGVSVDFDLKNPRAVNYLQQHALENTNSYTGTMKDEIALTIQEGVEQGQSVDEIASNLAGWFDENSDWKAERLARTETADAYSQGNLEGYRQSGVVAGTQWLCDEQACDVCLTNQDDGFVALNDNYSSGDDAPPAHPNCECALQPVTTDEEP